eukprot:CAMPEP_0183749342 /NCGR_PEP_ID=MMETSP0737-20130205/68236_1 /TAXON_ID=385413 /ORGANISM="Thalassiosira miniscula, Strain CCMP1093" /LENGTH=553 /DNA_ID=CAMNT_0025985095 /DNA_START=105 /DNA_END=1766 /DNA_ORIENTATION=+
MVAFASKSHPRHEEGEGGGVPKPLLPLYYPIHEMTLEEEAMHQTMVKEAPLDLNELASMEHSLGALQHEFRYWSISDYTRGYLNGTITPTQVADRLIKILERMDSTIVIRMNVEQLRSQAAESTKRYQNGTPLGVLDGIPIVMKDQIPTVGIEVTHGTSFLSEQVDKDVVYPLIKLKQQGVLVVGMANMHEIGLGTTGYNIVRGTPRNPYGKDKHYYTGGSSSGCAAAVAVGLVPLALGGDGGGSIRIPSSLCGCVGLKPTFKRIAMDAALGNSVFHLGPITSNVHDAALAYAIMAGAADNDHRHQSQKQPPVHLHAYTVNAKETGSSNSLKGLRIGVFEEHINDSEENVLRETNRAIKYYKSRGAEIIPITLPHLAEIHMAHGITITTEMFSMMKDHYHSKRFLDLSPETRVSLTIGKCWSAAEFLAAQKVRSYAMHHVEDLFRNKVDVILSPATPCCAPPFRADARSHGESNLPMTSALMRYVIHGNLTGLPAIAFPVAYDEDTSLPISLQIQAAHWREDLLLHVARESQGILKKGVAKPSMYVDVLGTCK